MKIFLAGTSLDPVYGGPAYSVSRLAVALAEAGLDVGLWAPDGSATTSPLLERDSIVNRLGGSAEEALKSSGAPDVIHDNGLWRPHNHQLAKLASRGGIARVVSTRGMLETWALDHKWLKKRVAWWLYQRQDLRSVAGIHATSRAEAESLSRLGFQDVVTFIPNGVDVPAAKPDADLRTMKKSDGVRKALFVGRIYPVKGLPMLVEAWARVRPPGWRLEIVGPDEAGHRSLVQKAVAAARLEDEISFTGELAGDAKVRAFESADLFVLPTHSESFGMAIGEALAYGIPVLTTTAAPWPELEGTGCGWRVAPTVEGLASGLRRSCSLDSTTLDTMGSAGRDFVTETLDWKTIAGRFSSLYEGIVGVRGIATS